MADKTYNLYGAPKPTTKRNADIEGPDFFPTPTWATQVLLDSETFEGEIWEPACGNGAMSEVMLANGYRVVSTDLYDRGYGRAGVDFLKESATSDNIITNHPYNSAEGFIHSGREKFRNKFALLLRLAFLEGANRKRTLFDVFPPSRVWVFSERITFYTAGAEQKGSGTTAYAWFVWDKKSTGPTELKWLPLGYKSANTSTEMNPMLFR